MRGRRGQSGLSLVEVLVVAALLLVTLTPLLGVYITSRRNAEDASVRAEALGLARATIDQMVARYTWSTIASEGPTAMGNYTVTVTVTDRSSYLKDVRARVEWNELGNPRSVEVYSAVHKREGL